jgi:hypothetical protein
VSADATDLFSLGLDGAPLDNLVLFEPICQLLVIVSLDFPPSLQRFLLSRSIPLL